MRYIDTAELDTLARQASASPRGRAHLRIHADDADLVQRFFVAADPRSYFRPHRHLGKGELAVVLRGAFDLLLFDAQGRLLSRQRMSAGGVLAYEAPEATWHTLVVVEEGSLFLEVKQGPYDPATAAEFAHWAPAEGDAGVPGFQAWLGQAHPGDSCPP